MFKTLYLKHYNRKLMWRKFSRVFLFHLMLEVACTEYFQVHLMGIICGRRSILKKVDTCLFSVFHGTGVRRKESNPYLKKSMGINIPGFSHLIRPFTEFNHAMRNSCKKNYHPLNVAYHRMEIRWNRSTNSLEKVWVSIGSYHRTDFAALSHVMRNSWENPGMSHVT